MVYRVYVEKRPELAHEAETTKNDIRDFLGITALTDLRLLNRYDVENLDRAMFDYSVKAVFSEPQLDIVRYDLSDLEGAVVFAVEYLRGQFDERADSAGQCIQIISQGERPLVKTAKGYALYGELSDEEIETVKKHLINPVESREASLDEFDTLVMEYDIPTTVATLDDFRSEENAEEFVKSYGLAMDADDLRFCQEYFRKEDRDPTITELKMIDTYWSDHCRHTTFNTIIDDVTFEDEGLQQAYADYLEIRRELGRTKPITLMDIGTIGAKKLKADGILTKLDESEEINACTVKMKAVVDGEEQDWLLLFKNETHNHPTEIEPFGGAATCIAALSAIRCPAGAMSMPQCVSQARRIP
jgi:phosphoribosylformylglycinamidine synthase